MENQLAAGKPQDPKHGLGYGAYKHMVTVEVAKACGCATGDLPCAWKRGHLLLHDSALAGDGTPLATRSSDGGGLTYAKNWRGVCLLDTGSKIPSYTMAKRMQALMKQVAFGMQAGFRAEHGAIDGLFAVITGLKKRQEHGPESYGTYVDLAKAFDTVNRKALWEVPRRSIR